MLIETKFINYKEAHAASEAVHAAERARTLQVRTSHVKTLIIHKLGFNQNCYTFTFILLIKIVLCSKFH